MNIILVGAGRIGYALARNLAHEDHNITVIDRNEEQIAQVNAHLDVMTICGEVDIHLLRLAGAEKADLLIAVTDSDEANILCCMVAKKLGVPHTIARVRQEEHYEEVILLREELGLSMTINPEYMAASEISRVLRFPSAAKVETFAKGQAELVEFRLTEQNPLCGMALKNFHAKFGRGTLICAVHREDKVHIPGGDFVLQAGDDVSVVGAPKHIHSLFRDMNIFKRSARYVLIVGGGKVGAYLARQLLGMGIHVKLLEKDEDRAFELKEDLPKAEIVVCDGSRPDILDEEGMPAMDAFVALTGSDETNIIIASCAKNAGVDKVVTKISKEHYLPLADTFGLETIVQPRNIIAQHVLRYVRGMENSSGVSGVENLRTIVDGELEVLEFRASVSSKCVGRTLRELPIRRDVLVAAIIRDGKCLIPGGQDEIWAGDSVLAVTSRRGMTHLEDILRG